MMKRSVRIFISLIICALLFAAVYFYYKLLFNYRMMVKVSDWFMFSLKISVPITALIESRASEYVLFGALYAAVFRLIMQLCKSEKLNYVIAALLAIAYSFQIFITDMVYNYLRFYNRHSYYTKLDFKEFIGSSYWREMISRYGFGILVIDFCLLFSILAIMVLVRYYRLQKSEDEDAALKNRIMKGLNEYLEMAEARKIVELYYDESISYKGVIDYINNLEDDEDGLKKLLYIEDELGGEYQVLDSAVEKAKSEKFGKLIKGMKEDTKKETKKKTSGNGKVIEVKFSKDEE